MTCATRWLGTSSKLLDQTVSALKSEYGLDGWSAVSILRKPALHSDATVDIPIVCMRDKNYKRIAATEKAEDEWTHHVYDIASLTLLLKTASWFTDVNLNVPEQKPAFLAYAGDSPAYTAKCDQVAANGYEGFVLE